MECGLELISDSWILHTFVSANDFLHSCCFCLFRRVSFEGYHGFQDQTGLALNAFCSPRHTAHHTINLDTYFGFLLGDNSFGAAVLVQLVTAARYLSAQTGWNLIWVSKTLSSSFVVCTLSEVLIDCHQCVRGGWVCIFIQPHCATFWFWFQSGCKVHVWCNQLVM